MSSTLTMPQPMNRATPYADGDDPRLFRRARTWFLLVALFLLAQANGIFTEQEAHYTLKVLQRVHETGTLLPLTIATVLICAIAMLNQMRPTLLMMLKQRAVLAFAVLAFLSTLWSDVPLQTIRKAALLSVLFALAWFCATYYSPGDQMRVTLAAGTMVALASLAMVIAFPEYGIAARGEWKGIFGQKNHLGIGVFVLFSGLPFCGVASRRRVLLLSLQVILPMGLILMSQSRNSWMMVLVLVGVRIFGPMIVRMRKEQIPFALYGMVFGTVALVIGLALILPMLGRDLTFTGRTREWPIIFPFALKHLWLGYGYQAFWVGNTGESGRVAAMLGAYQNAADNGYLDLMLQFGIVGLILLAILLRNCMGDVLKLLRKPCVPMAAFWYAGLILAICVGSFAESLFWTPSSQIASFMFVLSCAGLRNLSDGSSAYSHDKVSIRKGFAVS